MPVCTVLRLSLCFCVCILGGLLLGCSPASNTSDTDIDETAVQQTDPDLDALLASLLANQPVQEPPDPASVEMGHKFPFLTAELEGLFDGSVAAWGQDVDAWQQDAFQQEAVDCAVQGMSAGCTFRKTCEIRWLALGYFLDGYESIFRGIVTDFNVRLTFDDWRVFFDVKAGVEASSAQKLRNDGCRPRLRSGRAPTR